MAAKDQEGPRSFARFVELIAEGTAHGRMSQELHDLLVELKTTAEVESCVVKGSLTIKFDFKVTPLNECSVDYDLKRTAKKPKPIGSHFWLTSGANLSHENPRQTSLPLREVGAPPIGDNDPMLDATRRGRQ